MKWCDIATILFPLSPSSLPLRTAVVVGFDHAGAMKGTTCGDGRMPCYLGWDWAFAVRVVRLATPARREREREPAPSGSRPLAAR